MAGNQTANTACSAEINLIERSVEYVDSHNVKYSYDYF
ncbi:hypothetical protein GMES_4129 [Paraglaciecola mesophila KMM 241]|uniref:Uncharacterized protein n=1 Tax=Paraglaciecola mesophila KMM 241 TaxID=1128912 RepID=K6Z7Q7_9ALTE|nr:hypothetical protein GMES_4129 [Paraglaciecola mesophila KMM 241]